MKITEFFKDFESSSKKSYIKMSSYRGRRIFRYDYSKKDNITESLFENHSRGMVIDKDDNILFLSPIKAEEISIEEYFKNFSDIEVEPNIDGVMVNMFYDNEWILSTRGSIGGYNKWDAFMNFKNMFDECKNFEYDDLDKRYTYSFVVRHKNNRNVGKILYNEVYLVEMRDIKTLDKIDKNQYNEIFNTVNGIKLEDNKEDIFRTYEFKGYTFYRNNIRYKITNNLYDYVKEIKGSHNDKIINYLELRKNRKVQEYLKYYPEDIELVKDIDDKIDELINAIYVQYVNLKINKNIEMKDIEYHIKPCIGDIHDIYKQTQIKINKKIINKYINDLSIYKLKFILNYI